MKAAWASSSVAVTWVLPDIALRFTAARPPAPGPSASVSRKFRAEDEVPGPPRQHASSLPRCWRSSFLESGRSAVAAQRSVCRVVEGLSVLSGTPGFTLRDVGGVRGSRGDVISRHLLWAGFVDYACTCCRGRGVRYAMLVLASAAQRVR